MDEARTLLLAPTDELKVVLQQVVSSWQEDVFLVADPREATR
jgi:hypothetical protein